MPLQDYAVMFERNAAIINRLNRRIRETFAERHQSHMKWRDWQNAAAEFRDRYDELSFPEGQDAIDRIPYGDSAAIEAGLCLLECRPYFFRSGYMWTRIARRLKRAPLSDGQHRRLALTLERRRARKVARL